MRRLQRVGTAFVGAECAADDILGDVWRQRADVVAVDKVDVHPVPPVDQDLSLDVPHLRFRVRDKQATGYPDTEVGVDLAADRGPHLGRLDQERYGGGECAGPVRALREKRIVRNLDMEAAGIGARSLGVEVKAVDDQDLDAFPGKKVGGRRAGKAAADDQHVRIHPSAGRHPVPAPQTIA